MDDPRPKSKKSLADDVDFLASLSQLDRGLMGEDEDDALEEIPPAIRPGKPSRAAAPPARPPASARRTAPPQRAASAPEQALPAPPRVEAAVRPQASRQSSIAPFPTSSAPPSPGGAPARRPLIDLFPPTPHELERPPDSMLGLAKGPRLPRVRPVPAPEPLPPPEPSPPAPPQEVLTYETFYGLNENPFSLSPDLKFLYHSASHDRAAQEILNTIRRRGGVVVVTGEHGIGKTMLCRAIIQQLDRRTLTSFVNDPFVTVEELLRTMLLDFGVISREDLARDHLARATRDELTDTLRSFLRSLAALKAAAVVIVDEAQSLPVDVLAHIAAVTDVDDGSRVLQLVLVGEPALVATLRRAELKQLDRRVTLRCELGPLMAEEMAGYVMHRVAIAGTSPRVEFDDHALMRAFELSSGVPRVVNLISERALTLGHEVSASVIEDELVEAAAEDLELAPPPTETRGLVRLAATALVLMLLMLVGAAAAAWVFRDQLERAVVHWQAIPSAPGAPVPRLPVPLAPIPPN